MLAECLVTDMKKATGMLTIDKLREAKKILDEAEKNQGLHYPCGCIYDHRKMYAKDAKHKCVDIILSTICEKHQRELDE